MIYLSIKAIILGNKIYKIYGEFLMRLITIVLAVAVLFTGLLTLTACQIESPIENHTWMLISYGSPPAVQSPLEGTQITVYLNSEEKTVSGSGGCNHYSGTYEVDGLSLSIHERMAVTEMWCGEERGLFNRSGSERMTTHSGGLSVWQ